MLHRGIAVLRWGEPRLTRDLDLTIYAGFGNEAAFVDPLLEAFDARLPDMRSFALSHRVLLLTSRKGFPIDIALGGLDYEKALVSRSTSYSFHPGLELRTCSAEDLIEMKAFAERERDWRISKTARQNPAGIQFSKHAPVYDMVDTATCQPRTAPGCA